MLEYALREALGDDPRNPRYIETIRKGGYRLIAPVEPEAGAAGRRIPRRGVSFLLLLVAAAALVVFLGLILNFFLGAVMGLLKPADETCPADDFGITSITSDKDNLGASNNIASPLRSNCLMPLTITSQSLVIIPI